MSLGFPRMAEILQPRRIGVAEIRHYEITDFDVLRETIHGGPIERGKVAILSVANRTMMSDTLHEKLTNYKVKREARGNVLIAGLGIGMILHPILAKPEVLSVTVLEKERDVIELVAPTLKNEKLTIVHADIFEWRPKVGAKFDCICFDIWADGTDDLAKSERRKLSARFRKYKAEGGWMGSWKPMTRR